MWSTWSNRLFCKLGTSACTQVIQSPWRSATYSLLFRPRTFATVAPVTLSRLADNAGAVKSVHEVSLRLGFALRWGGCKATFQLILLNWSPLILSTSVIVATLCSYPFDLFNWDSVEATNWSRKWIWSRRYKWSRS
jgi:hypothetical protein